MTNKVTNTLNVLKARVEKNQNIIQQENGESCHVDFLWNPPASIEEIQKLATITNWYIPDDYRDFLLQHNGAALFMSESQSLRLHPINEVIEYFHDYQSDQYNYKYANPPYWFMIGSYHGFGEYLFIDSKKAQSGTKEYLVFIEDGNVMRVKMNFEDWLDRFIVCQGEHFWTWDKMSEEWIED